MRESGEVLGSITAREGERETEEDTGLTVCVYVKGREREEEGKKRRRAACFEQDAVWWLV